LKTAGKIAKDDLVILNMAKAVSEKARLPQVTLLWLHHLETACCRKILRNWF